VDNFSMNRAYALDASLFDLQRIEVLRGPQGTFFGRSATGGAVNIITARPGKEHESSASLELGDYSAVNMTGMLNIPISDRFQIRAAATSRKHDGYRKNTYVPFGTVPGNVDDEDTQAGRISIAFQPSEHFHGFMNFQLLRQTGAGQATLSIPFRPNPIAAQAAAGNIDHAKPNLGDPKAFPVYSQPFTRVNEKTTKWEFGYDGLPGGASLTYVGGVDSFDFKHEGGGTNGGAPGVSATNPFLPIRPFIQNEHPVTWNHELRLASSADGKFTWQTGLFFLKEKSSLFSHALFNPGAQPGAPGSGGSFDIIWFAYDVDTQSKAAFAQGSVKISDTSKVTAGVRYSKDDVTRSGAFQLFFFPAPVPQFGTYNGSKTTWTLGYDYTPTDTNLMYAKVGTGYKPGGFESCANYNPENVRTVEVGSKNRFNDGHLQLNGALFHNTYSDQQVQQFVASCATGSITTNAGKSKIYGFEGELRAALDNIGRIDVGLTYLHATYDTFVTPPTIGNAGALSCARTVTVGANINCELAGNSLPVSPKLTLAAGFEHDWAAANGTVTLRLDGRYTGKQFFDPFNFGDSEQDAYTLINANLSYSRDNWKIGLYGRNLADKDYLNYATEFTAGGASLYNYSFGAPRVIGARFELHMH
jgi:iron complex outermembrane receptor protein